MKTLTELEYSMLMQAIQNGIAECEDQEFIDPYATEYNYTDEDAKQALLSAEAKLQANFLPEARNCAKCGNKIKPCYDVATVLTPFCTHEDERTDEEIEEDNREDIDTRIN